MSGSFPLACKPPVDQGHGWLLEKGQGCADPDQGEAGGCQMLQDLLRECCDPVQAAVCLSGQVRFPGETPPSWQLCLTSAQRILKYTHIFFLITLPCAHSACMCPVFLFWVFPALWEQAEVPCGDCWGGSTRITFPGDDLSSVRIFLHPAGLHVLVKFPGSLIPSEKLFLVLLEPDCPTAMLSV